MQWKIKTLKVTELKEWDKNPRNLTEKGLKHLEASIRKFGVAEPLVVNTDHTICGGHGRLATLKKLGIKEVDCYIPEKPLTDKEFEELNIRLNKNIAGEFDFERLANEWDISELQEWGFDDLDFTVEEPEEIIEDEAPEPPEEPKTKLGDIYQLGEHRVMCGDSTSIDDVEKLMNGEKADMVFTDPPYNQETEGGFKGAVGKALRKQSSKIASMCDFNPEIFLNLLPTVFKKNTLNTYIFCNKDLVPEYLRWAVDAGYSFNILFWKKPNAIPIGGSFRPDVEYLLTFRKSGIWNSNLKNASYSKCLEFSRESSTTHPTMKPVALIVNQILISSNPNSCVLDLFGGSGSTLIACEQTGRVNRSMELDPKYCDVIIERWEKFTGKKAKLISKEVAEE